MLTLIYKNLIPIESRVFSPPLADFFFLQKLVKMKIIFLPKIQIEIKNQ